MKNKIADKKLNSDLGVWFFFVGIYINSPHAV